MYPYRDEQQQAALEHLAHGPYASDDKPYLSTQRYSLSGYEPHNIADKQAVDAQGVIENWIWYNTLYRMKVGG
jgi:hypothetical protein